MTGERQTTNDVIRGIAGVEEEPGGLDWSRLARVISGVDRHGKRGGLGRLGTQSVGQTVGMARRR